MEAAKHNSSVLSDERFEFVFAFCEQLAEQFGGPVAYGFNESQYIRSALIRDLVVVKGSNMDFLPGRRCFALRIGFGHRETPILGHRT